MQALQADHKARTIYYRTRLQSLRWLANKHQEHSTVTTDWSPVVDATFDCIWQQQPATCSSIEPTTLLVINWLCVTEYNHQYNVGWAIPLQSVMNVCWPAGQYCSVLYDLLIGTKFGDEIDQ